MAATRLAKTAGPWVAERARDSAWARARESSLDVANCKMAWANAMQSPAGNSAAFFSVAKS